MSRRRDDILHDPFLYTLATVEWQFWSVREFDGDIGETVQPSGQELGPSSQFLVVAKSLALLICRREWPSCRVVDLRYCTDYIRFGWLFYHFVNIYICFQAYHVFSHLP